MNGERRERRRYFVDTNLFVNLTRKVPKPLTTREAMNLVSDISHWRTHAPQPADVLSAIELHEKMSVSFWDAMILTSACALESAILYSEDFNLGQTYGGVLVVNPLRD